MSDSTEKAKPEVSPKETQPVAEKAEVKEAPASAPVVNGGSNKLVIIIVVIVVLLGLCAACGFGVSYLINNVLNKAATEINNNISDATKNLPGTLTPGTTTNPSTSSSSGSSSTGTGSFSLNASLPSDVPVYPGATDQGGYTGKDDNGNDASFVTFETTATLDQVVGYYLTQLPLNGWASVSEYNFLFRGVVGEKSDRSVAVLATESDGTTSVIVTVSSK